MTISKIRTISEWCSVAIGAVIGIVFFQPMEVHSMMDDISSISRSAPTKASYEYVGNHQVSSQTDQKSPLVVINDHLSLTSR